MVVAYSYTGALSTPEKVSGFFESFKNYFLARAMRMGIDRYSAEDSFQDVALKSLRRVAMGYAFDDLSSLRRWACKVQLNYCRDIFRRKKSKNLGEMDEDVQSDSELIKQVEGSDEVERLNRAIGRLPGIYRDAILGVIQIGNYEKIAKNLGVKLKTIGVRIHRAKSLLKADLEKIITN